jgi:hypothetical protein
MVPRFLRVIGILLALSLAAVLLSSCDGTGFVIGTGIGYGKVADHEASALDEPSSRDIEEAKDVLSIAYWHTSHGSQIVDGLSTMDEYMGGTGLYAVGDADAPDGYLRLDDRGGPDLGEGQWDAITREWLDGHPGVNVIMWSWCGQVSGSDEAAIDDYLARMTALEEEYRDVRFVYMTGHADGSGEEGNLHQRNSQIREYCEANGKFLFDFYDIECYDPDGRYYGDRHVTDGCDYDGGNWAIEWQNANPGAWWECGSAHSQPLNANMKARAAWRLFVSIAKTL